MRATQSGGRHAGRGELHPSPGDIALACSDHDGARERYEAALPLYRRVGDVQGEANCILSLGDIALARSDHDGARERYDEALSLYRRLGHVLGEANCIRSLGDIARECSDHDGARERYETALPLYRRVGLCWARRTASRAWVTSRSRARTATVRASSSTRPWRSTPAFLSPYSIGRAHDALARVAQDEDERVRHIAAAREAWLSIGRDDLVRQWLDQTGASADRLARGHALRAVAARRAASRLHSAGAHRPGRSDAPWSLVVGALSTAPRGDDLHARFIGAGAATDNRSDGAPGAFQPHLAVLSLAVSSLRPRRPARSPP